ncbi:hypothetical protein JX265_007728 [Neoarthrinium moseri]|uniref:Uncharacterized protein n=1 Tax=Neoarthrinium moseri TaxID=1658444 RepID=A0A9P9WJ81_9PEZI|nr:hypothetical protein JX265_007728 [Neoarthrinium moseri]
MGNDRTERLTQHVQRSSLLNPRAPQFSHYPSGILDYQGFPSNYLFDTASGSRSVSDSILQKNHKKNTGHIHSRSISVDFPSQELKIKLPNSAANPKGSCKDMEYLSANNVQAWHPHRIRDRDLTGVVPTCKEHQHFVAGSGDSIWQQSKIYYRRAFTPLETSGRGTNSIPGNSSLAIGYENRRPDIHSRAASRSSSQKLQFESQEAGRIAAQRAAFDDARVFEDDSEFYPGNVIDEYGEA